MKRLLISLLIIFLVSCAGTNIPAWLTWHQEYKTEAGTPIDTSDIEFEIFIGDSVNLVYWTTTPDTFYYLLQAESLYTDTTYWFYVRSYRISTGSYSSGTTDTVGDFFPVLKPDTPYNLKTVKLK